MPILTTIVFILTLALLGAAFAQDIDILPGEIAPGIAKTEMMGTPDYFRYGVGINPVRFGLVV